MRQRFVFGLVVGGLVCIFMSALTLAVLKIATNPVNVFVTIFEFGIAAFIIGAIIGMGK